MHIHSKPGRYGSLIKHGTCSTRDWLRGLRYSRGVRRWMSQSLANKAAVERLLAAHDRSLPYEMRAGHDVTTELDLGEDSDSIYVQTSCGTHPSWERARASRGISLSSLVAFPSEF